jgi:ATP-binding cassette subfamily B protein
LVRFAEGRGERETVNQAQEIPMSQGSVSPFANLRAEWVVILRRAGQVWKMVAPRDKLTLSLAALTMAIGGAASAGMGLMLGQLANLFDDKLGVPVEQRWGWASFYLGIVAGLFLVAQALEVTRKLIVSRTTTRMERDTVVALVSHLLKIDLATLSRERIGSLHGRISRSVEGYIKFVKLTFMDVLPTIINALCALTAVIIMSPLAALVMACVLPFGIIIIVCQILSQKGIRVKLMRAKEGIDGTVVEQLGAIEYIRAANTNRLEEERVAAAVENRRQQELKHVTAMAMFDSAKAINDGVFLILVFLVTFMLVSAGQPLSLIVVALTQYPKITNIIKEMHRVLDEAHESSLRVGDLLTLLNEPVDRSFGQVTMREPTLDGTTPALVMENVAVDYRLPDGRTRRGLENISMVIRHGETIGAAGRAGSGKSTWLKVLMRLVHPATGQVIVGGIPLETLSRPSIAKLVGYVSQTPVLFAGTVAENISYGCEGATPADIEKAARLACIHDEIAAMPDGYQAIVSERGGNLSGGQRQRVALARVFLRNPPILILDEGTSALDNINERNVQQAIATARTDRTVILVAHRLTTLRDANRIFVFDSGRIIEEGAYEELLQRDGAFAEMARSAVAG